MSEESKNSLLDLDKNLFHNILCYIPNKEPNYFHLYENICDLLNTCKALNKLKYDFSYFDFFYKFFKKVLCK